MTETIRQDNGESDWEWESVSNKSSDASSVSGGEAGGPSLSNETHTSGDRLAQAVQEVVDTIDTTVSNLATIEVLDRIREERRRELDDMMQTCPVVQSVTAAFENQQWVHPCATPLNSNTLSRNNQSGSIMSSSSPSEEIRASTTTINTAHSDLMGQIRNHNLTTFNSTSPSNDTSTNTVADTNSDRTLPPERENLRHLQRQGLVSSLNASFRESLEQIWGNMANASHQRRRPRPVATSNPTSTSIRGPEGAIQQQSSSNQQQQSHYDFYNWQSSSQPHQEISRHPIPPPPPLGLDSSVPSSVPPPRPAYVDRLIPPRASYAGGRYGSHYGNNSDGAWLETLQVTRSILESDFRSRLEGVLRHHIERRQIHPSQFTATRARSSARPSAPASMQPPQIPNRRPDTRGGSSATFSQINSLHGQLSVLRSQVDELVRNATATTAAQNAMQRQLNQEVASVFDAIRRNPAAREAVADAIRSQPEPEPAAATRGRCVVCHEGKADMVFVRCGHVCTCVTCARQCLQVRRACPICRAPVVDCIQIFNV